MARAFVGASSQYLQVEAAPTVGNPVTMACWFRPGDATNSRSIFTLQASAQFGAELMLTAAGATAGDPVGFNSYTATALTTTGYSLDTWHHACGTRASLTDRKVYIDGGSEGTNTTSIGGNTPNQVAVARRAGTTPTSYFTGRIAEAAIWDVVLTASEISALANGYSPLFIRPQNLVFYLPLIRDDDEDIVGGLSLTAGGAPTVEEHVRVFYPSSPIKLGVPAAAGGDLSVNVSESVTLSESIGRMEESYVAQSESVTLAEAIQAILIDLVSVSDNITITESVKTLLELLISSSESITVSESIGRMLESYINKSENVTISEAIGALLISLAQVTDNVTLSETITTLLISLVSVTDNVTVSEAIVAALDDLVSAAESITVSEAVTALLTSIVNLSENITVSESVTVSFGGIEFEINVSDTITLSESIGQTISDLGVLVGDNVALSEAVSLSLIVMTTASVIIDLLERKTTIYLPTRTRVIDLPHRSTVIELPERESET